jgi:hypothetical protein
MKKYLLTAVFLLINAASAQLLTEDFNYSGNLTDNGWARHSGTTDVIATTTGQTYSGFVGSGTGNAANVIGASEDVSLTFTRQTGNGLTLYMTALINVTDAANSLAGGYFLHLGNRIDGAAVTTIENQFVRGSSLRLMHPEMFSLAQVIQVLQRIHPHCLQRIQHIL